MFVIKILWLERGDRNIREEGGLETLSFSLYIYAPCHGYELLMVRYHENAIKLQQQVLRFHTNCRESH